MQDPATGQKANSQAQIHVESGIVRALRKLPGLEEGFAPDTETRAAHRQPISVPGNLTKRCVILLGLPGEDRLQLAVGGKHQSGVASQAGLGIEQLSADDSDI